MKHAKAALFLMLSLAACSSFGITGAEAAALITSEPSDTYYVTPDTFNLMWWYYDGGSVAQSEFTISADTWTSDIESALQNMKSTVNTLALNSFEALAKIAALQEVDAYLNARIDILTDSAREALASLDTVEVDDGHGNTSSGSVDVGDHSLVIHNLDVAVDGASIDYTGARVDDKTPSPIEVFGFKGVDSETKIPHKVSGKIQWDSVIWLADSRAIGTYIDNVSPFGISLGLKGWDTPTQGTALCGDTLSDMLTGLDNDSHYVLTKFGSDLHYTKIGKPIRAAECDNLSITTNETYKFHIVGVGDAVSGQVLASDGRAGVDWANPSPVVSYDDQGASFTISPGGNDDSGDTLVYLPYVYIEEEEDGWTFTVRQVNSFDGTEEEPVFIPRASNTVDNVTLNLNEDGQMQIKGYSDELDANQYVGTDNSGTWGVHGLPSSRVDTYSIVTNASQHEGEAALAGFWESSTTDGMFPVKSGDTLAWVPTNATDCAFKVDNYSVVTNADQHEGEAALAGFWDNATVDGMFPVKSGGTLTWVRTNSTECAFKVDDASITTNSDHGATTDNAASLYGWSDAATGAFPSKTSNSKLEWSNLDARTLTFNTLNGDKVIGLSGWNYNYSGDVPGFLANMGGQLVYLSVPVPIPPDGESVEAVSDGGTTNLQIKGWKDQSECGASLMSMISHTGDENRGTHSILCRVDGGNDEYSLHYLPIGLGAVIGVDGYSIVTNADDHAGEAAIAGFWDDETESGMFPVKSGDTLVWVPTNSAASSFKVDTYSIVTNEPGHEGEAAIAGFWSDSAEGDVLTRSSSGLAWTAPPRVVVDTYSVVTNGTGHNGEIAISGFWEAEENAMPHKEGNQLVWGGVSAVTNRILAGAGINITDNGGGAITISAEPLEEEESSYSPVQLSVITDVRYDPETHKFQCKRRTVVVVGQLGEEDDWEDVFEAVSHQSEHDDDGGGGSEP